MKKQNPAAFVAAFAGVALALLTVAVAGTGCRSTGGAPGNGVTAGQNIPPQETDPTILPSPTASPAAGDAAKVATVYRVVSSPEGGRRLERVNLAMSSDKAESPATFALDAMAAMKDSPLPKGTRVRGVKVDGDLATVDFNDAFQKNYPSGDENEAITLNALIATLGQFPNVRRVQILVEGQKVALGGMQDTTEPLEVGPDASKVATAAHSGEGDGDKAGDGR